MNKEKSTEHKLISIVVPIYNVERYVEKCILSCLNQDLSKEEYENRQLLCGLMTRHGFVPFENEWWHYNLKEEPYPETYFDFPLSGSSSEETV